ncbi:sensor histidine kinase [Agromyces sp. SYSU T00194]|uniref:sensor histidine kinase n=1 Tax=Agromyces chitinivorans TaxID=3158560 RepID=UPI003394B370
MGPRILSYAAVAVVAVLAATAAVGALYGGELPPLDVVFVSILFTFFGLGVRAAVIAWRSAHRAAAHAARTIDRSPEDAARAAVDEERARMSADIEAVVRRAVLGIRSRATALEASPRSADAPDLLRAIQREGRAATAELRLLLELLRAPGGDGAPAAAADAPRPERRTRPAGLDFALATIAVVVCIFEGVAGPSVAPDDLRPFAVSLGALAAAATLAWRIDPGATLLAQAVAIALGSVFGAPVSFGIWTVLALGLPMWAAAARPRRGQLAVAGPIALAVAGVWSQVVWAPDNVGVLIVILIAAALTGLASRLLDARRRRSAHRAAEHDALLAREADAAVRRDRIATARELHDAVSGTIGVIVMQAGAAELRWADDRPGALRAIDVIVTAAEQAVDELDDLMPRLAGATIGGSADRGLGDLPALVERMRRAGVDVTASLPDPLPVLPGGIAETAYRITQEGVANAVRHAPGARIAIRVDRTGDDLEVTVIDDGAPAATRSGGGYGLTGLAERVAEVGGEFAAGPAVDGGFRLVACMPLAVTTEPSG